MSHLVSHPQYQLLWLCHWCLQLLDFINSSIILQINALLIIGDLVISRSILYYWLNYILVTPGASVMLELSTYGASSTFSSTTYWFMASSGLIYYYSNFTPEKSATTSGRVPIFSSGNYSYLSSTSHSYFICFYSQLDPASVGSFPSLLAPLIHLFITWSFMGISANLYILRTCTTLTQKLFW